MTSDPWTGAPATWRSISVRLGLALAVLLVALMWSHAQPVYPGGSPTSSPIYCIQSKAQWGPAGTYEMIPAKPGESIYICGFNLTTKAPSTWQMIRGTGPNCSVGTQPQTPAWEISGNAPFFSRSPVAGHFIPRGEGICIVTTGAVTQWVLFYSQF